MRSLLYDVEEGSIYYLCLESGVRIRATDTKTTDAGSGMPRCMNGTKLASDKVFAAKTPGTLCLSEPRLGVHNLSNCRFLSILTRLSKIIHGPSDTTPNRERQQEVENTDDGKTGSIFFALLPNVLYICQASGESESQQNLSSPVQVLQTRLQSSRRTIECVERMEKMNMNDNVTVRIRRGNILNSRHTTSEVRRDR